MTKKQDKVYDFVLFYTHLLYDLIKEILEQINLQLNVVHGFVSKKIANSYCRGNNE